MQGPWLDLIGCSFIFCPIELAFQQGWEGPGGGAYNPLKFTEEGRPTFRQAKIEKNVRGFLVTPHKFGVFLK